MAKAAKENDRLLVQWVIIMSYATFQFCYGGLETLPWEAKACLLSIKTLHGAQCEHITRTFFSPFQQGKKKDNKQEKETLLPNPHTTTPLKDMYIPHNSCFTNHSPSLALWSMPFPHCHTVSFAIREALSSHVGSKCLFLTLWLLQMWHSHAQSLCHPKSPAVKLLGNARRRKASWQHLIMPSNDALGRTG